MPGGSGEFIMVPVGPPGPPFRPDETYFSVALLAVHMPGGGFFSPSKFAPVVWASVTHCAIDGENGKKRLLGLYPAEGDGRPKFAREDRVTLVDLQLVPRIIAGEELEVDFTLAKVREKDFLAGILKTASELAASPATSFVSQIMPGAAGIATIAKAATDTIGSVKANIDDLLDADKVESLGHYKQTLRSPSPSGAFAFIRDSEDIKGLKLDANTNKLSNAKGPITSPYAVVRLQCETNRPDWMILPDLVSAWTFIRETKIAGGDVAAAIDTFRLTAETSPDLTPVDAKKLTAAVRKKFAPELAGEESAESGDLGDMESALAFFMDDDIETQEASNGETPPWVADGPFRKCLEHVLLQAGETGGLSRAGYREYLRLKNPTLSDEELQKASLSRLTPKVVAEIFYLGYWRAAHCSEMPNEALAAVMFDAAVNHGAAQAIRLAQQGAGMAAFDCDGAWGDRTNTRLTIAAADTVSLIDGMLMARERFYRLLVQTTPSQGKYLRAWMNQLARLRARVAPLIANAPPGKPTESAMLDDTQESTRLRVAEPDFRALHTPPEGGRS
jgi:hypothetical protein